MSNSDNQRRIVDGVDAGFDTQLATTRDFVAIPSTRGAEGPCQDMIGDLLRPNSRWKNADPTSNVKIDIAGRKHQIH